MSDQDALKKKLRRLVHRIVQGSVVPFVGAGISLEARVPGSDLRATVAFMEASLRKELCGFFAQRCQRGSDPPDDAQSNCFVLAALLKRCDKETPPLSQLAEISELLWGSKRVCEILRFEEFTLLDPLPVHRYLAFLAREGLIKEIITTNYDCCIERAYRCSFGPSLKNGPEDLDGEIPVVIRNLEEYRRKSTRWLDTHKPERPPILRLYKINGCANAYKEALNYAKRNPSKESDEALRRQAERIILTERQLQSFRTELWALDLFRDRARTHNLLFCGFGSEEPQVRHSALAIAKEFQQITAELTLQEVSDLQNAPWVAAYEQLTFYQMQILASFVQAHLKNGNNGDPLAQISNLLVNCFLGQDAHALGSKQPNKLPADLFFSVLFARSFCLLLSELSTDGSVLTNWLRAHVPRAWRYWRDGLDHLSYDDELQPVPSCTMILEPSVGNGPLRLWNWLWAMLYPLQANTPPPHWYLPLVEEPLLIPLTLILIKFLLAENAYSQSRDEGISAKQSALDLIPRIQPNKPYGLAVNLRNSDVVYLVAENASTTSSSEFEPSCEGIHGCPRPLSRLIRRIAVPDTRYEHARFAIHGPKDAILGLRTLYVGHIETLGARDLIQATERPTDLVKSLRKRMASRRQELQARLEPVIFVRDLNREAL